MYKFILRNISIVFVLLAIGLLSSCAYKYEPLIKPERIIFRNDIKSTLVLPFIIHPTGDGDPSKITEIFSSELARFSEINVVHPDSLLKYIKENKIELTEKNIKIKAVEIGKRFNVQTVIIGSVTEYNAFYPPIFGLSVEIIDVQTGIRVASRAHTYDSSFNYVINELKEYSSCRNMTDSLYREELVLHSFDHYMRFVSYQFIKKYL